MQYLSHRMGMFSVLVLLGILATLVPAASTQAQSGERCFEETGFCISGPIRVYWESNGGLPVFGFPITDQRVETVEGRTLPVQWFQRDRLEIQENGTVTAGRLGARLLELQGRPWDTFPTAQPQAGCTYFPETSHNLCEPFLTYWQQNGGLERFGYPITETFMEEIEDIELQVQYFERRRMEYHTQIAGQPVLLGLLGTTVREIETGTTPPSETPASSEVPECIRDVTRRNPQYGPLFEDAYAQITFRATLGCPFWGLETDIPASTQSMERGQMWWVELPELFRVRDSISFIHALIQPADGEQSFRRYVDTWVAGEDPDRPDVTPPRDGLYAPWRGFGKVWQEDAQLRQQIGWAIEPQARDKTVTVLTLSEVPGPSTADLRFLILDNETSIIYAFGDGNNPGEVQVIRP